MAASPTDRSTLRRGRRRVQDVAASPTGVTSIADDVSALQLARFRPWTAHVDVFERSSLAELTARLEQEPIGELAHAALAAVVRACTALARTEWTGTGWSLGALGPLVQRFGMEMQAPSQVAGWADEMARQSAAPADRHAMEELRAWAHLEDILTHYGVGWLPTVTVQQLLDAFRQPGHDLIDAFTLDDLLPVAMGAGRL